jgi:REP element-mobilizing transposase RayT
LAQGNLLQFSGKRYDLKAWVIMPNHVHVLAEIYQAPMSQVVGSFKKHTGRRANVLLGLQGAFWARDYFDVYMRSLEHENRTIRYIESNPVRSGLVREPQDWPWSSARHRDKFGALRFRSAAP